MLVNMSSALMVPTLASPSVSTTTRETRWGPAGGVFGGVVVGGWGGVAYGGGAVGGERVDGGEERVALGGGGGGQHVPHGARVGDERHGVRRVESVHHELNL